MCLALFVLSCLGLPNRAYAAPVDLLENQNEIMGQLTEVNLFENESQIQRYSNTYWEYVSTYSETGSTSGTETTTGNQAAHTATATKSVPSYKITTASHEASLWIDMYGYASTGYGSPGNYHWHFTDIGWGQTGATYPKIKYPSVSNTVAAHTETGTLAVPKVTISSSGAFDAQDTRTGVMGPMALRYNLNGFTSAGPTDVYAVMSFTGISNGSVDAGSVVYEGDIIKPVVRPKPVRVDTTYTNRWQYEVKYFGFWGGTYHEFTLRSDGTILIPHNSLYFVMVIRLNSLSIPSGAKYLYLTKPSLYIYNDFGLDKLSNEMQSYTQQQTEELKDTTGADTVLSDITGQGSVMAQKLGFVYQTGAIARNLYEAMQYEGEGTVTFPALAWEGQTIIAETDVPITGWLPSSIEDRVRDGVTLVFFLAWLHGMHSLYARIFLGQIETESGDD